MIDCENCIHVQMCKWCDEMVKTHTCDYYETYDSFEPKRPHGEWIPCAERLPEEYNSYLVTKLDPNPSKSTFTTLAYFYTEETGWDIDGVIAWMPFPKPYKKEGDAE